MNNVLTIIQKEFREIWRDPYSLGVAVFLPLVMLFLFGYALNLDVKNVPMAVVDLDNSPSSRAYIAAFINTKKFDLKFQPSDPATAGYLLDRGKVKIALFIPSGFSQNLAAGKTTQVQTLIDGSFTSTARVIQGYVEGINESYTAGLVRNRLASLGIDANLLTPAIVALPRVQFNQTLESDNFILPSLIGVLMMAFPPLLSALAIVREKEHGSIHQIFISPVRPWVFIVGKLIPYMMISYIELMLVFLAVRYWFGIPMAGNVWLFLLASVSYVLSTVAIGLLISSFVGTQLGAMLAAVFLTMMPAFVFTGFMWSIDNMPMTLQVYSHIFPGRYFIDIIQGAFLRGVGPEVWAGQVGSLILYTGILVALASFRFKKKAG